MADWIKCSERMPESNKPVLAVALAPYSGNGSVIRTVYAAPKTVPCDEMNVVDDFGEYDEDNDCYWCPEGWYEWNLCEETHWHVSEEITHWQPLPQPPERP